MGNGLSTDKKKERRSVGVLYQERRTMVKHINKKGMIFAIIFICIFWTCPLINVEARNNNNAENANGGNMANQGIGNDDGSLKNPSDSVIVGDKPNSNDKPKVTQAPSKGGNGNGSGNGNNSPNNTGSNNGPAINVPKKVEDNLNAGQDEKYMYITEITKTTQTEVKYDSWEYPNDKTHTYYMPDGTYDWYITNLDYPNILV